MKKKSRELLQNNKQLNNECEILLKRFSLSLKATTKGRWPILEARLKQVLPQLLPLYLSLYGERYDCYYHLEQLLKLLARALVQRPDYLLAEDDAPQQWHKSQTALGSACYVDLFAGDFSGLEQRIPILSKPVLITCI